MKQVSPAMIKSVQPILTVPVTTFFVEGYSTHGTEMKTYCVCFGAKVNFLRCSCAWFRRNRSLCKHFYAVIDSGYREFEDLTALCKTILCIKLALVYLNPKMMIHAGKKNGIVSTFDYHLRFYKI